MNKNAISIFRAVSDVLSDSSVSEVSYYQKT